MKINSKILSIPPYISSSWDHITSLHIEQKEEKKYLVVLLNNGSKLEIPGLSDASIEQIFLAHEQYIEEKNGVKAKDNPFTQLNFGIPLSVNPESMKMLFEAMQDPSKLNHIEIPEDVAEKIASFASSMGLDPSAIIPEGDFSEESIYGQLRKAFGQPEKEQLAEEEVSDEELTFKEWDIVKVEEQLYRVTNPLDQSESYQVFLGNPMGCTCGKEGCEHLQAVLRS